MRTDMPKSVAAFRSSHSFYDRLVGPFEIEALRLELTPCPPAHRLMLLVTSIQPCFQKVGIARVPTYIQARWAMQAFYAMRIMKTD